MYSPPSRRKEWQCGAACLLSLPSGNTCTGIRMYLRGIHMFWNRMDKRVSKDLYNGYTEIFRSLKLPVLETVIPSAERYKKDSGMKGPLFRSTLFPPSSSAMKGSSLDLLAAEIETILKLQ